MGYVCKSLSWWQTGVLVAELKWEPSSQETDGYLLPVTMVHPPDSLIVPIPMDVQTLTEQAPEVVFEQFMQKLTPLLTLLDTGLRHREPVFTALISLVENVRSWPSTRESYLYSTIWTTE
jgi:hypothetical protein